MTKPQGVIAALCLLAALAGCAHVDSRISQDLRLTLADTREVGYGTGHGTNVKLIGKLYDPEDIRTFVGMLKFGAETDVGSREPLGRYIFFMNADKTMTTIRFEGEKIQYQGKEFKMNRETSEYLDRFFQ